MSLKNHRSLTIADSQPGGGWRTQMPRNGRADASQPDVIRTLIAMGCEVWVIEWPCDLLVYRADIGLRTLEVKTIHKDRGAKTWATDKRQVGQLHFLTLTGTAVVTSIETCAAWLNQCAAAGNTRNRPEPSSVR